MGSGEDLKNEMLVRYDAWNRIKPGMTPLMQAADKGDAVEVRRLLQRGEDVNAVDETGWTALMIAAVTVQPQAISALLDGGARVDQQDRHGDTALIGCPAVRFGNLHLGADIIRSLLSHGASVENTNDLAECALMWAARAGNVESIGVLVKAGANPSRRDRCRQLDGSRNMAAS
jgi:ankyrin repeat protein